jgi:glucokinase
MIRQQSRSPLTGQADDNAGEKSYVIGVDIGGTNLRLALADVQGNIAGKWSLPLAGVSAVEAVLDLISEGVESLLRKVSSSRHALRAIAAGAPGITDAEEGTVIATSYLMGWRNVPLRALLEERFQIPAAVDNDVNLAAIGERWAGAAKGVEDFVFLAIGTGIGAGIVLNGRPFRGSAWAAGEVGYMLVPGTQDTPGERGKPGALESMVGGDGIASQWQSLWRADQTKLPRNLHAGEIFDYALAGDALAQTILHQSSRLLALAIYNIVTVLNCPLFVFGGGVGMHPVLYTTTKNILRQWKMRNEPELLCSKLGPDAQLMGSLALAVDLLNSKSKIHHLVETPDSTGLPS